MPQTEYEVLKTLTINYLYDNGVPKYQWDTYTRAGVTAVEITTVVRHNGYS